MHVVETEQATQAATPTGVFPAAQDHSAATRTTDYLDQVIPLKDASHADVVSYTVEVPMRYAECFAMLRDGRKVSLADRHRFVGWSGDIGNRSLLFRKNLLHIELRTNKGLNGSAPGPGGIFDIVLESAVRTIGSGEASQQCLQDPERSFISKDGSLITLPGRRMTRISGEMLTSQ